MERKTSQGPAMLPGFQPLAALWEGEQPLYPSEQSAVWAVRTMRQDLIEVGALALHRGRTFVHLEKLAAVAERTAIAKMHRRHADL